VVENAAVDFDDRDLFEIFRVSFRIFRDIDFLEFAFEAPGDLLNDQKSGIAQRAIRFAIEADRGVRQ